ncbi:histidine triad nucleotide-binding protein [Ammoniphilus sp. YIM 78166]|uniref:histidine triad nucleotide-binding protein n=1 Tax=Ammoniphilus sp. YIM 78166 TaxID=1644106 RepID=UPI00106F6D26|nr:histidine triad nucleotide-binding protein [Ammoniphilus sp. YIM 78166]
MEANCLFCKIIEKQIPAKIEYEDEKVMVFHDIHPKAPVHLLIIPKKHIPTMMDVAEEDLELIAYIHKIAQTMYHKMELQGMRLINNCGEKGGQEIFHLHYHLWGWKE